MPPPPPEPDRSASGAAYATLRQAPQQATGAPPQNDYLLQEAEKLAALKLALWQAFSSAHDQAIPTALVDLVTAYTSALRLQLSLIGMPRQTRTSKPASLAPKTTQPP